MSLKLAGGARPLEDVWKPDYAYYRTYTALATKQISTGTVSWNGGLPYLETTGVWGQAAAQQQLNGTFRRGGALQFR